MPSDVLMDIYRDKNYYKNLKPLFNGKNGYLYDNGLYLDKILLNPGEKTLEKNNILLERKNNLKLSNPIEGNIFIDNICVGSLLPFFRTYSGFSKIIRTHDYETKTILLNKAIDSYLELQDNFIYPIDIHEQNILVNRSNSDIEIIDLTDSQTFLHFNESRYLKSIMYKRISNLVIKTLCYPIIKDNNYTIQTLETINIPDNYIDLLKTSNDLNILKEFNELTLKDKVFVKKINK